MIVKLLTEHNLEFLSLKGGCRGLSESTHVKIPYCWKSHALADTLIISTHPPTQEKWYMLFHLLMYFVRLYCKLILTQINLLKSDCGLILFTVMINLIWSAFIWSRQNKHYFMDWSIWYLNGPRRNKTCLRGFRQSKFQTSLLSYRD